MRCATATRPAVVLLLSQMLSGCMMAGMGGMGHAGARDMPNAHAMSPARNPTIVKEVLDREIRMTAEFPDYLASDSLIYTVTLRSLDGRSIKPDAKIFLSASATPRVGAASTTSMSRAGHDGMVNRDTRDTLFRIMVAPVARDGGTFTFAPSIPRDGPYRIRRVAEVGLHVPRSAGENRGNRRATALGDRRCAAQKARDRRRRKHVDGRGS